MSDSKSGNQRDVPPDRPTSGADPEPGVPSLEEAYRANHEFVWRSVRRLGVPSEHADDATQEVFMVVARRLHEFRGQAAFRSWLFAIAMRVAQHHHRAHGRHVRRVGAFARFFRQAELETEDRVARRDAVDEFHQLLAQLDERKRVAFILVELEGWTAQEVADAMDLKTATVYSRVRLARESLRKAAARAQSELDELLASAKRSKIEQGTES